MPTHGKPKPATWKTVESSKVYSTRIFDLHHHRRHHHQRGHHDFYVLEAPDWVNIIPLTEDEQVVMVRQFRHGTEDFTLEIPGGMVDPEDLNPMAAARREMREESGYDSEDIIELGKVHPNPAIQGNYCHTFLARGVHSGPKIELDTSEETEVILVPLASIKDLIAGGEITHALVIAAFSFLHVYNPPSDFRHGAKQR
ncbi:MAG TPA: NUDIX hydrolase [Candidatus Binataceae bacterium]|nr:NUDIX hydrolase [Candidatus Binataceae bacterium]